MTAVVTWHEAPAVPARATRPVPRAAIEALALVVAVIGPAARVEASPANRWYVVIGVGVVASALVALCPDRLWLARLAVIAGATVGLERMEGPLLAVWIGLGLGLADWGVRRRRPVPWVPAPEPAGAVPITVLVLLAAYQARESDAGYQPLRFVALAVVLTLVGAFTGDLLPRLFSRLGHLAGVVVGRVLFLVLGVPVVAVPWVGHRLVHLDPLRSTAPSPTSWARRRTVDPASLQPWSPHPLREGPGWWYRLRRLVALPLLCLAVAGGVVVWRDGPPDLPDPGGEEELDIPAAYDGADWYPGYVRDLGWILGSGGGVWQPLRTKRVRDVHTGTINVVDGVRHTWSPPPCSCERLTVWLYGGSTAFGLGQRDEHTIASELARVAWADGIALDVVNRGQPGHMHWTEANQLAWDLTVEDPPDLVAFYDGVNELWGVSKVDDERDLVERIEPLSEDLWDGIARDAPRVAKPDDGVLIDVPDLPERSQAESGALAVDLYDRSRKMARDVGEANDLPIRYFWQPSRLSRPPIPAEPLVQGASHEDDLREFYGAAETRVPDGVGDLTDALDGTDEPLFSDDVHHNEEGARLIADAMYAQLGNDLRALVGGQDVAP